MIAPDPRPVPWPLRHITKLLVGAIAARFADLWAVVAIVGPLLVAHGVAATLRRTAQDRRVGDAVAMTLRVGGGLALMVGAAALRTDLEGVWTVLAIGLAVGLWGIGYQRVLAANAGAFARA